MSLATNLDDNVQGNEAKEDGADEVRYEIVDDTPEEDRRPERDPNAVGDEDFDSDEEIEGVGEKVNKRIKRLRYEFHEQKRRADAAEKMQREAIEYAKSVQSSNAELKGIVDRGEKVLLSQIKQRTDSEIEAAKNTYKAALEEGDVDAVVAAQERLAETKYEQLTAGTYINQAANDNGKQQQQQQQQQQAAQQQGSVDPRANSWAQNNPWFGQDKEMTMFAYGVHENLVNSGIDPVRNADEYYKSVDKRVREVFPGKFSDDSGRGEPPANRGQRTVVAPGSRSSGKTRKVQITPTQAQLAKRLGISLEDYAKEQLRLQQREEG